MQFIVKAYDGGMARPMSKLVFIDACIRQGESRTRRIAYPILSALSQRYKIVRYDLTEIDGIVPLNPKLFEERGQGDIPAWAVKAAKDIAEADRILIAAPFWDMSFPAVLKCFFEQTSLFDITFTDNGKTCAGLCKAPKVLYITTRGMNIPTGDSREQGTSYLQALSRLWDLGVVLTVAAWNMDYSTPEEIEEKIESTTRFGVRLAASF